MINTNNQSGVSLVIALLFVIALTGVLTGVTSFSKNAIKIEEAEIAGQESLEIARAARVLMRDLYTVPGVTRETLATQLSIPSAGFGGAGPIERSVADLINERLLSADYGRLNGTTYVNALNQPIRIFIANYPIDGDPTDSGTIPAAYVLFESSTKSTTDMIQYMVQYIRSETLSISAPLFDSGNNITALCDGAETVALWDSGCLSEDDYDLLIDAGVDDNDQFTAGSFLIPTWKTTNFDTRAFMRFPQPEQTDVQTMLTDLSMGVLIDCNAAGMGFVTVPIDGGSQDTALCQAIGDFPGFAPGLEEDNSRSITGIDSVETNFYIADPMGFADIERDNLGVTTNEINDETNAINIVGNLALTGDTYVYTGAISTTDITVDKNIFNSGRAGDAATSSALVSGLLNTENANATLFQTETPTLVTVQSININNDATGINNLTSNNDFKSQTVNMGAGDVSVGNLASVGGVLTSNQIIVSGAGGADPSLSPALAPMKFISADIVASNISVNGNVDAVDANFNVLQTAELIISNDADTLDATGGAQCISSSGACPLRPTGARYKNCEALDAAGILGLTACLALY